MFTFVSSGITARKLVVGFVAGFIAVFLFHQPALALLSQLGIANAATYSFAAVPPFGVPRVISIAFWGGVWGVIYAAVEQRFNIQLSARDLFRVARLDDFVTVVREHRAER